MTFYNSVLNYQWFFLTSPAVRLKKQNFTNLRSKKTKQNKTKTTSLRRRQRKKINPPRNPVAKWKFLNF